MRSFHEKILAKLSQRREKGALCLVAEQVGQGHHENDPVNTSSDPFSLFSIGQTKSPLQEGTIIGTIEFSPSDFADTSMAYVGYDRKLYLMDLAVKPRARRTGVASALLKEVEAYAIRHDFRDLYLHVETSNDAARCMYLKSGFKEVLPLNWAISFTEKRLHKPWENYVLLFKKLF